MSTSLALASVAADAPVEPSIQDIAKARLEGMRGNEGDEAARMHALGVELGLRHNGSFFYPSEDRALLECVILPYYQLSDAHRRIVFVGNDWYTQGYVRLFRRKWYMTIDPNPERTCYGNPDNNRVDIAENLVRHVEPGSIDAVFLNGIIGWGLDDIAAAERTFAAFATVMRPGADLMIGWNDLPEHKPFALDAVKSLVGKFRRAPFAPLGADEHMVPNEWRHTFSFYKRRAVRPASVPLGKA